MQKFTLEVCCSSTMDIENAIAGGADRLEICSALSCGGVTPSLSLISYAKAVCGSIPYHILIRPREGNFVYNEKECQLMIADIEKAKELGASGVVIGALTNMGSIDIELCSRLSERARNHNLSLTFSRAFDLARSPIQALNQIIDLGFDRVLTSGDAPTAFEGKECLKQLVEASDSRISIMAASGVNDSNFLEIISYTGVHEIHGSLRGKPIKPSIARQLPGLDISISCVDIQKVKTIKDFFNSQYYHHE